MAQGQDKLFFENNDGIRQQEGIDERFISQKTE